MATRGQGGADDAAMDDAAVLHLYHLPALLLAPMVSRESVPVTDVESPDPFSNLATL